MTQTARPIHLNTRTVRGPPASTHPDLDPSIHWNTWTIQSPYFHTPRPRPIHPNTRTVQHNTQGLLPHTQTQTQTLTWTIQGPCFHTPRTIHPLTWTIPQCPRFHTPRPRPIHPNTHKDCTGSLLSHTQTHPPTETLTWTVQGPCFHTLSLSFHIHPNTRTVQGPCFHTPRPIHPNTRTVQGPCFHTPRPIHPNTRTVQGPCFHTPRPRPIHPKTRTVGKSVAPWVYLSLVKKGAWKEGSGGVLFEDPSTKFHTATNINWVACFL